MDLDESYDFGFSLVSGDDIPKSTDKKLETVTKLFLTLLENLKREPEKDYIYWPDRVKKINEFSVKLKAIVNG